MVYEDLITRERVYIRESMKDDSCIYSKMNKCSTSVISKTLSSRALMSASAKIRF